MKNKAQLQNEVKELIDQSTRSLNYYRKESVRNEKKIKWINRQLSVLEKVFSMLENMEHFDFWVRFEQEWKATKMKDPTLNEIHIVIDLRSSSKIIAHKFFYNLKN
tara:strand:- start:2879 stop:3196 length:318 start_codon:yes stop_codon:yes gene_type:complete